MLNFVQSLWCIKVALAYTKKTLKQNMGHHSTILVQKMLHSMWALITGNRIKTNQEWTKDIYKKCDLPTNLTPRRTKELKLQPAALISASAPPLHCARDRQQNRIPSPIMICGHATHQVRGGRRSNVQDISPLRLHSTVSY